jgi:hypothetical protein
MDLIKSKGIKMKLRTKVLAIASMLPIMANAYYIDSTACATPVYVEPINYMACDNYVAPVMPVYTNVNCNCGNACNSNNANYAPQTPNAGYNTAPVSNYNTQQYYTPVVQTTIGYYR